MSCDGHNVSSPELQRSLFSRNFEMPTGRDSMTHDLNQQESRKVKGFLWNMLHEVVLKLSFPTPNCQTDIIMCPLSFSDITASLREMLNVHIIMNRDVGQTFLSWDNKSTTVFLRVDIIF